MTDESATALDGDESAPTGEDATPGTPPDDPTAVLDDEAPLAGPDDESGGRLDRLDPLGVAVGSVVGLAGALFVAQPSLGRVPVGGARIPAFVLAAGVLGLGFAVGAVGFWVRGQRRLGVGHGVGAVAWLALFVGASVGSGVAVVGGVVVVIAGAFFLADALRRRR